jgi:hypothetical protein
MNALLRSRVLLLPGLLLIAGCATTGHPCFSDHVMYADNTAACHYGRSYRCDNGDWIAYRRACNQNTSPGSPSIAMSGSCEFGGVSYASGSASCNAGRQYRCDNGTWSRLDLPCSVGDAPLQVVKPSGISCSYNGTSVANNQAICQSGTTFLCDNGQWINLGTVCR